jgi:hypothetical protein
MKLNLNAVKIIWAGEGIHLPAEQLGEILDGIANLGVSLGFERSAVSRWRTEDFGLEGSMNDTFGAKVECRRKICDGMDTDLPPAEAVSVSLSGNGVPSPVNLTFCQYPKSVKIRGEGGQLVDFETKIPDGFQIKGNTSPTWSVREGPEELERTHSAIFELLQKLEKRVHGVTVLDNTGYSRHQKADRLYRKFRNETGLQALYAGRMLDKDPTTSRAELSKQFPVLDFPDFEGYEMEGQLLLTEMERSKR